MVFYCVSLLMMSMELECVFVRQNSWMIEWEFSLMLLSQTVF